MDLKKTILLAKIGRPQGLHGDVRVKSYTHQPIALADYNPLFSDDGRSFEIVDIRAHKGILIVRFSGIDNREAAEPLNGLNLFVERTHLADDELATDEFFHVDLEGLEVVDKMGKSWGLVKSLFNFGSADVIELCLTGRRSLMIPFTKSAVPVVDIENGRIIIDPIAAGLADDGVSRGDKNKGSESL